MLVKDSKVKKKFLIYDMREASKPRSVSAAKQFELKDGDKDMTDLQQRMGRPIQVRVFIQTLKKLNPNLVFELSRGDSSKYGIYIESLIPDASTGRLVKGLRHITGMESGINLGGKIDDGVMPEFSYMESEQALGYIPIEGKVRKVPKFKREIRGWRTVLAALYLERLLTETQIEQTFHISEGQDSANWQQRIRNPISDRQGAING